MKKSALLLLSFLSLTFFSCENDDNGGDGEFADFLVARPIVMSRTEFANSFDIVDPLPIDESGKIYAYQDYIFVNDKIPTSIIYFSKKTIFTFSYFCAINRYVVKESDFSGFISTYSPHIP